MTKLLEWFKKPYSKKIQFGKGPFDKYSYYGLYVPSLNKLTKKDWRQWFEDKFNERGLFPLGDRDGDYPSLSFPYIIRCPFLRNTSRRTALDAVITCTNVLYQERKFGKVQRWSNHATLEWFHFLSLLGKSPSLDELNPDILREEKPLVDGSLLSVTDLRLLRFLKITSPGAQNDHLYTTVLDAISDFDELMPLEFWQ